jgi:hypothetical protein
VETAPAQGQSQSLAGFPAGTIVVRTREGGRSRDILVELPSEIFPLVKPGVSDVRMTGTLERISGCWHLLEPRSDEPPQLGAGDDDSDD